MNTSYVFISYSTKNQSAADSFRDLLASEHISTWMAPYDIPGGSQYAKVINQALKNCSCFLLLLSKYSINSIWVQKETERAINHRKTIIPIELENVVLNDEFEFYISTNQILAINKIEKTSPVVQKMLDAIRLYVKPNVHSSTAHSSEQKTEMKISQDAIETVQITSAKQGYEKAIQFYYGKDSIPLDYVEAVKYFYAAALKNHRKSQEFLGYCYEIGRGIASDTSQAFYWYTKSAQNGSSYSQYKLGYFYEKGIHVEPNLSMAVEWYSSAAQQNHAASQYRLALCYHSEKGVSQDYEKALYWFSKAAEQGHMYSQSYLGYYYDTGLGNTPKDYEKAFYWYTKSAEQGYFYAQHNLGYCYHRDSDVYQDYEKAFYWFSKAAEQKYRLSEFYLGYYYDTGTYVPQDYSKAVEWYTKSAEQNYAYAQYNLALCYEYGKGVKKDPEMALQLLQKAADQGLKTAIERLKQKQPK